MPETLEPADDTSLLLNGAGIRKKFTFELYVGGLYLQATNNDAEEILASNEAMGIRLHIISSKITSKKMTKATMKGFKNSTDGNTQAFEAEIADFLSAFEHSISVNDIFDIFYLPKTGIQILKNEELSKSITCDNAFKEAVFGIWLSNMPAQKSLKSAMLGIEK